MTEITLNDAGKILCLIDGTPLVATAEEWVRQGFIATLIDDYGYSPSHMRREVPIYHGRNEVKDAFGSPVRADIAVYVSEVAAQTRDQGQIKFVVECKKPDEDSGYTQLVSYIFSTNSPGGVWTNGDDTTIYRANRTTNVLERGLSLIRCKRF